ncbi:RICIN domain-containing protein [Kitasatospora sp. NA04385]|nr:RICIN domain-containing protein [Kitasatospora sp. NA04385]
MLSVPAWLLPAGEARAAPVQAAPVQFTPGQAWTDTADAPLQLHGLGIVKAGSTWYGFGEDKTGESSADTSFQGIACYSSTDLAHWTPQGPALGRQSSGDLGPNRIVERPKVLYNAATKTYVMYLHIDDRGYGERKVGVATSSTPCGPYTYRGSFRPLGQMSLDIGLFQDTDGTGYLLTEDRANGLRIDRLSADYLGVDSTVHLFPGQNGQGEDFESPALVKAGGRYYLLGSHLTGWGTNDNVYSSAPSLTGPWEPFRTFTPVGTRTYDSQTANIVPVQGSAGTTYVYAADRWNLADLGASPSIWLPMTISGTTVAVGWQNAWSLDPATGTWTGSTNPPTGTSTLSSANSGLLMDVSDNSTADGGKVIQWPGNNGANQKWALTRVGGNVYTLTNLRSGKCLEVPAGSVPTEAVQLDQSTCTGAAHQQWAFNAAGAYSSPGNTSYQLVNLASGLVADVSGGATGQGAAVIQYRANSGTNQVWNLRPAS